MGTRLTASGLSGVRKPARSSDTFARTEHAMRKTISAHPMGIVQQRPRGDLWEPVDWYQAEWWRIRLARMLAQEYFAGFGRKRA